MGDDKKRAFIGLTTLSDGERIEKGAEYLGGGEEYNDGTGTTTAGRKCV
jgi:hypothetical protein